MAEETCGSGVWLKQKTESSKSPEYICHPEELERGMASSPSWFSSFLCKNILKWNIKMCCFAFRSKPKDFLMAVLVTEYIIHIGSALSLSPISPGRKKAPVVSASLTVLFLPVVKGQIYMPTGTVCKGA